MDRIAAEIAKEIGVLFQNDHLNAGAREEVASHHSGRSAADNDAASASVVHRFHRLSQIKNGFYKNERKKSV